MLTEVAITTDANMTCHTVAWAYVFMGGRDRGHPQWWNGYNILSTFLMLHWHTSDLNHVLSY